MAHCPGDMPSVETEIFRTVPSGPATRLKRVSLAVPSGAVNQETISSPAVKPRMETVSGVPLTAVAGEIVALMEAGSWGCVGLGAANGTRGVGSGPPYNHR